MEDYKEKYEQALKKAKAIHNLAIETSHENTRMAVEELFHELKESEDKRIIKAIIEFVKQNKSFTHCKGVSKDDCLAWLEKQGEQKTTDKVEPKFKAGDYIINEYDFIMQIDEIVGNMYIYHVLDNNCLLKHDITKTEESCHLWTIQDAKDGDILAVENMIFVYKTVLASHVVSYCKLFNNKFDCFSDGRTCCEGNSKVHPSIKAQRDLLFQKMKEAGYEWDAENKELRKIEQKLIEIPFGTDSELIEETITIPNGCYAVIEDNKVILRKGKQKPAWSEEDERYYDSALWHIKNSCGNEGNVYNWLKSLKERMKGE